MATPPPDMLKKELEDKEIFVGFVENLVINEQMVIPHKAKLVITIEKPSYWKRLKTSLVLLFKDIIKRIKDLNNDTRKSTSNKRR